MRQPSGIPQRLQSGCNPAMLHKALFLSILRMEKGIDSVIPILEIPFLVVGEIALLATAEK